VARFSHGRRVWQDQIAGWAEQNKSQLNLLFSPATDKIPLMGSKTIARRYDHNNYYFNKISFHKVDTLFKR
jgi:hypothetical protein